jgi:ubiquinone/menaquinone biosynthesis C-methylase UbiE
MPTNESEKARWNDDRWTDAWPDRERLTNSVSPYLLAALGLEAGERVLDIGCGGGGQSITAAQAVGATGAVVGVDVSEALAALARRRATEVGAANVTFVVSDAQVQTIDGAPFDVAMSQFGVMFFDEPVKAFSNLRAPRLLAAGGAQPVAYGRDHGAVRRPPPPLAPGKSAVGPFSLGDEAHTTALLESVGFTDVGAAAHDLVIDVPASAIFSDNSYAVLGVEPASVPAASVAMQHHLEQFAVGEDLYKVPLAFYIFHAVNP